MNISNNILKHHLKNVLFISGTAYAGKTTMTKLIEKKYGIKRYREGTKYDLHMEYADKKYQPAMCYKRKDLYSFFNRPYDEYGQWFKDTVREQAEMAIIDLIKLSKDEKIIADVEIPLDLLVQIADPSQVVLLYAEPELIRENYFAREDKKMILDCIMSMPESEKTLNNMKKALDYAATPVEDFEKSSFKCIPNRKDITIEERLSEIVKYFKLEE